MGIKHNKKVVKETFTLKCNICEKKKTFNDDECEQWREKRGF